MALASRLCAVGAKWNTAMPRALVFDLCDVHGWGQRIEGKGGMSLVALILCRISRLLTFLWRV